MRTSVSQSLKSVGRTSSMKSCVAASRITLATAAGNRSSPQHHRHMQVQIRHGRGHQAELRPTREQAPQPRRRQTRAQTARPGHRRCAPRTQGGDRPVAEIEQLRQRKHRPDPLRFVRDRPLQRPPPPAVHLDVGGDPVETADVLGQQRHAAASSRDGVDNRVAVFVAQGERIQQRDGHGERLALVGGKRRRIDHAFAVDAAERRQRHVEAEQRSTDVPRDPGHDLRLGHRPRQARPQAPLHGTEAEIVAVG